MEPFTGMEEGLLYSGYEQAHRAQIVKSALSAYDASLSLPTKEVET